MKMDHDEDTKVSVDEIKKTLKQNCLDCQLDPQDIAFVLANADDGTLGSLFYSYDKKNPNVFINLFKSELRNRVSFFESLFNNYFFIIIIIFILLLIIPIYNYLKDTKFICSVNDKSSCSGHGRCINGDTCLCDKGWYGHNCFLTSCYGFNSTDPSVCSQKGKCIGLNTCKCNKEGLDKVCSNNTCFNISSFNSSVCSGNGVCTSENHCFCNSGFNGDQCEKWKCFGIGYMNSSVCSRRGRCVSFNKCDCDQGYSGKNCSIFTCFNRTPTDPLICSGNGKCIGLNNCSCEKKWFGNICEHHTCFGIKFNDTSVCSTRGKCTGVDLCECQKGWSGSQCSVHSCYGFNSTNPLSCSGNGKCEGLNQCKCKFGFKGEQCENIDFEARLSQAKLIGQEYQHKLEMDVFSNYLLNPEKKCYCMIFTSGHCTGKSTTARKYASILNTIKCDNNLTERECQMKNGVYQVTGEIITENSKTETFIKEFDKVNEVARAKNINTIFILDEIQLTTNLKIVGELILHVLNKHEKIIFIGILNFYKIKDVSTETFNVWNQLMSLSNLYIKDYQNLIKDFNKHPDFQNEYLRLQNNLKDSVSSYILNSNKNQMSSKCRIIPYFHYNYEILFKIIKQKIEDIFEKNYGRFDSFNKSHEISTLFINDLRLKNLDLTDSRIIFDEFYIKMIENPLLNMTKICKSEIMISTKNTSYSLTCSSTGEVNRIRFEKRRTPIIQKEEKKNSFLYIMTILLLIIIIISSTIYLCK